jgi:hypothetical protein
MDNPYKRVPFLSVLNLDPPIPHTCEHCKFYESDWKFCNSIDVEKRIEANDYLVLAFSKDFGCIFWGGKE